MSFALRVLSGMFGFRGNFVCGFSVSTWLVFLSGRQQGTIHEFTPTNTKTRSHRETRDSKLETLSPAHSSLPYDKL
jgi:hypothetical protein